MRSKESERRIQHIIEKIRAADEANDPDSSMPDLCDEDQVDDLGVLPVLIADIEKHVGGDLLDCLDPVLIGDFCMVSVMRNEGTGLLLRSLVESFMRAYADDETSDQAVQALLHLESLSNKAPKKPH